MKILYLGWLLFIIMLSQSCTSSKKITTVLQQNKADIFLNKTADTVAHVTKTEIDHSKTDSLLVNILKKYPEFFDSILNFRKQWNVQIIYTQINRDQNNLPSFSDYYFNVDSTKYFYPASTVKLPIAILALQRLNELSKMGITKTNSMITEAAYTGQVATYNDPQTIDGRPTIESYIKRIFLVSDNEAFNRLYEFLGQQYVNAQLHEKGYNDAQILHRLNIFLTPDENRHTNPVEFRNVSNKIIYSEPMKFNKQAYPERQDSLGKAYLSGNKIIHSPMDFSKKNRISLEDLHSILRSIIFPGSVAAGKKFNLTDSDYSFLHKYMSMFPGESIYPSYDTANYPDAYGKFLLYGSSRKPLPKNIRIFNKIGDAYGQMIDVAYVTDLDRNIEFFLSATIYCNSNGIINDDKYDYDTIGFPFMQHLGQVMYDYDLQRKRNYTPDLSSFKLTYNK